MEKNIKDYLHLYLGCDIQIREYSNYGETVFIEKLVSCSDEHAGTERFEFYFDGDNEITFRPILRPLSDMTEEECRYLAWFHMDSEKHLEADARITIDEVDTNIVYGNGGLMGDADAAVVIEISCRCFEGQLCVRTNGDLEMWSERGERLETDRQCESVRWLLSKGFDLFDLIPAGLAIDATTLTQKS